MAAAVASIPKEQWNQIPALAPPPGQVPNFQNPGNVGPPCFIAASVFLGVMLVFYIARVYAKCGLTKKLSWDDCEYITFLYAAEGRRQKLLN